ncbi:MAG TPA: ABC transporter ATP-binding protein [Longimicrobiaceae bacterium]|nr:ABC transporter ATP-binding protein [Longimicrobiaceae bacterium]
MAPALEPAITVAGLRKVYRNGVEALSGVDLQVEPGEILCLVGPNGAGKTTLLRILSTGLSPTAGDVTIFGHDLRTRVKQIRSLLAVVPQEARPDPYLTVWEHICYYLVARGMDFRQARRATEEITERLELSDKRREMVSDLSGGMRRRVLICMALASGSRFLMLDEPTTGLDLLVRRRTWQALAGFRKSATMLLTTHSMEEAEALADRVGIIHRGRLVALGTPRELQRLAPGPRKVVVAEHALLAEEVAPLGKLQLYAGKWAIFPRDDEAMRRLLDLMVRREVEVSVQQSSLEDVFVHLVGEDDPPIRMGELR